MNAIDCIDLLESLDYVLPEDGIRAYWRLGLAGPELLTYRPIPFKKRLMVCPDLTEDQARDHFADDPEALRDALAIIRLRQAREVTP